MMHIIESANIHTDVDVSNKFIYWLKNHHSGIKDRITLFMKGLQYYCNFCEIVNT